MFFQPISSCSFLAIFLASVGFAYSFVIPGTGGHRADLSRLNALSGTAAFTVQGSWPRTGLWQPHPARLLSYPQARAVYHAPWLTVFEPGFNIFLCLVIYSPSSVVNLFHHCPLGHVGLPREVGSCFVIYGSCPGMVSSDRVTSF